MPPSISSHRRARLPALSLSLFLASLLALCLALSACGGAESAPDAEPAAGGSAISFPVSVQSGAMQGGEPVTIEARPRSIVSLSATATEMLWAIGAEDQVVAVDDQSDYPEGVPTTELSGYEPNVEAILGYAPDLVVSSGDSGDLVGSLRKVDVPVLVLPSATNLEESYSQIERLGSATGHVAEAAEVVAEMRAGIENALAEAPHVEGTTYFHELSPELFTVSGSTFIGEVYSLYGLSNIADEAGQGDDYPQLSSEYVVSADPDLVFVGDHECCAVTPGTVRARPGWQQMSAVRDHRIYVVDEDITSRWGPRVVEFVELVGEILAEQERARPAA